MAFVHAKENMQKAQTEKANQTVKEALGDHDLDQVAGGGANGGALIYCKDTFEQGENCWFADDCNMIINNYEGAEGFVFYELVDDVGNGGWIQHQVSATDTLIRIANKYGISDWHKIIDWNPHIDRKTNMIRTGEWL